jgi:hypothetical protein
LEYGGLPLSPKVDTGNNAHQARLASPGALCLESAIGVTAVERCNLRLFSNC